METIDPGRIKIGLERCAMADAALCTNCHYRRYADCATPLIRDALAYIYQLEAELSTAVDILQRRTP